MPAGLIARLRAAAGARGPTTLVEVGLVRLLERIGRSLGFSPEGRPVRVWVRGAPGDDETEVVSGTVVELVPAAGGTRPPGRAAAVVELRRPLPTAGGDVRFVLAEPSDPDWGLHVLWFSFIAIEARRLAGPGSQPGQSLGRWFIRLGRS